MLKESMILAKKDLHTEFRTKQMLNSMLIFAFIVIIIFYFGFSELLERNTLSSPNGNGFVEYLAPGILWITFIFTGMLGLSRSFAVEKDKNSLEGLMLCPVSRNTIYLGKVISNIILMFIIEIATIVVFYFFVSPEIGNRIAHIIPIIILGTLGFVIVGSLLSALSINTRNREMLLPLILFPIIMPIIIRLYFNIL